MAFSDYLNFDNIEYIIFLSRLVFDREQILRGPIYALENFCN